MLRDGRSYSPAVVEFYDRWTRSFVDGFGTTFQAGFAKRNAQSREDPSDSSVLLAERAEVSPGDRVLDAGCGVCGPAIAIARSFGVEVHGFTVSPVQAITASRLIADAGLKGRVSATLGDYHHLPVQDASFDRVLFLESCGYSPARDHLFTEAARVLRPGGTVYVKDVFREEDPLEPQQHADVEEFDRLWSLASSPTLSGVARDLANAGCEIVRVGPLPIVGTDRFVGAMFEIAGPTIQLSPLGRQFFRSFEDLPLFFGEVLARKPTVSSR
ncbi:MAG TPA: methyltransferase domain-containing protein [Acidimicrobiia bacterium]|nr:methyltransferase domain-containing protein [Acidimicrobiia bacterium]